MKAALPRRPVGQCCRAPGGDHRRRDQLRHPRQEPPQRRQLRQPRPVDGSADRRRTDPDNPDGPDPDLFQATVGGNGLTRIIMRATIEMTPTGRAYFIADGDVTRSLDETIAFTATAARPTTPTPSAWFDAISAPRSSVAPRSRGDRWPGSISCRAAAQPLKFDAPQLLTFPDIFPNGLAFKYTSDPSENSGTAVRYLSELGAEPDAVLPPARHVRGVEPCLRPAGFLQYQFVGFPPRPWRNSRRSSSISRPQGTIRSSACSNCLVGKPSAAELSDRAGMSAWTLSRPD